MKLASGGLLTGLPASGETAGQRIAVAIARADQQHLPVVPQGNSRPPRLRPTHKPPDTQHEIAEPIADPDDAEQQATHSALHALYLPSVSPNPPPTARPMAEWGLRFSRRGLWIPREIPAPPIAMP